ncbi:MAG TPA: SDR family NAD(P)-dependent oxidoreductase, partial [Myxococcota bacterium]|nr:SDR family NAD(P)-dependent oxidoreductase [Myxococcota bacterium]
MGGLHGQRALVTGGASGIGLAAARRLREEGARVALLDLPGERLEAAAAELGAPGLAADVRDAAAVEAAFAAADEALGGLTIAFLNAGAGQVAPLDRYAPEEVARLVDVNLVGTYNGLRAAVPRLLAAGGGTIVTNASVSGLQATRGEAPYAAAKAGVLSLTRSAALEYGPRIRVNCVSPGMIRTPLSEGLFHVPGLLDPLLEALPAGRAGTAEEVAEAVAFLCSPRAAF